MPERKKQHYVPKLYMRGFTDTEKLPSYQLDHRKEFQPTSIHNLCYENYFYSENPEKEEATMRIEDRFATVLQTLRNNQPLSALEEDDWMFLLIFLTHTHTRTKNAKVESQEFSQEILRIWLEANEGVMDEANEKMRQNSLKLLDEGKIQIKNNPAFKMQELVSMYGLLMIGDLKIALLRDSTGMEFIFSDHPVVLDNPMFRNNILDAKTGFQTSGLQIFCPISSELTIMMYDPNCYQVPGTDVIDVGSDVISDLNKLQILNSFEAVFYETTGRESEMRILHEEVESYRPEKMTQVKWFDSDNPRFDTDNEVFGIGQTLPDFSPELPFVQDLDAEFTLLRSPEMYSEYKSLIEEELASAKRELKEKDS